MPTSKVLLVEDNDASAEDYVRWLTKAGHTVERASARSDALALAESFHPEVILLDLQIPSEPGRADENVEHGFATLRALVSASPFRPIVVVSAHTQRELTRRAMQETHGGGFVFKDSLRLEQELKEAVAVAAESPAWKMSKTVAAFRDLVNANKKEDEYRKFIHQHWQEILGPEYKGCESPFSVGAGAQVDILAIRHDGFPDLWELKLPNAPVFSTYNQWLYHSNECAKAIGQLMYYYDLAEKSPTGILSYAQRNGVDVRLNRPRGFVVLGRRGNADEQERLRLENSFLAGLTIMTYDDLIERAEQYLLFLQRYRNGTLPR